MRAWNHPGAQWEWKLPAGVGDMPLDGTDGWVAIAVPGVRRDTIKAADDQVPAICTGGGLGSGHHQGALHCTST